MEGFVYIVQSKNLYKIGRSQHPEGRVNALKIHKNYKPKLLYKKYFKNSDEIETATHQFCKDFRIKGEWFKLDKNMLKKVINNLTKRISKKVPREMIHLSRNIMLPKYILNKIKEFKNKSGTPEKYIIEFAIKYFLSSKSIQKQFFAINKFGRKSKNNFKILLGKQKWLEKCH